MTLFPPALALPLAFAAVLASVSRSLADDAELPQARPVPEFQAVPMPGDAVSFQRGGVELTRYHFAESHERPFWFPFIDPASGRSVTRMGHPHDPVGHSHHNSVWISHHDIDGFDFWSDNERPESGRVLHERVLGFVDSPEAAGMTSRNRWVKREDQTVLLTEDRTASIHPARFDGASATDWLFLIDLTFAVPEGRPETTFGSSPFGVLGVRMAKTIGVHDGGGRIRNSEGAVNEEAVFRKPARWVDYSGPIAQGAHAGITLLAHPDNPGFPQPVHVRNDGWMGPCLTLESPLPVTPDRPLHLRYALWIHHRVPDPPACDAAWEHFRTMEKLPVDDK